MYRIPLLGYVHVPLNPANPPSLANTQRYTGEREAGGDQAAAHSFGLVEKQHTTPRGVRQKFCKGLTRPADTAHPDGTNRPQTYGLSLLPVIEHIYAEMDLNVSVPTESSRAPVTQPPPARSTEAPAPLPARTTCQ